MAARTVPCLALLAALTAWLFAAPGSPGQAAGLPSSPLPKIDNYARFVKELQGVPFFEWRVFIDEPPEVLEQIAEVRYELHPTFNDPIQVRRDATTKFALDRGGWGEFQMPVTIRYKDGRVVETRYRLDLRKPWPDQGR